MKKRENQVDDVLENLEKVENWGMKMCEIKAQGSI